MADEAISIQQVKDSLDAYVQEMNILTGDLTSGPNRIKEFLDRHECGDLLSAFNTLENKFNESQAQLEIAREEVAQATNELKAATLKFDQLDYEGSAFANKQETEAALNSIAASLDQALEERRSLMLLIEAAKNAVVTKATKEELKDVSSRVYELGNRMSSLEFLEKNNNTNQELSLQRHDTKIASLENKVATKADKSNVYTKDETNSQFAYKRDIPTLDSLGGLSKETAARVYGERADVEQLKQAIFDMSVSSMMASKINQLQNEKADIMKVYSKEDADRSFALKRDILSEERIRTIAADEAVKRTQDSNGDMLYITLTQAEDLITKAVALEVTKQLKEVHVIPENFGEDVQQEEENP